MELFGPWRGDSCSPIAIRGKKLKTTSVAIFAGIISGTLVQPFTPAHAAKFEEKVLHTFGTGEDGAMPQSSLIDVKGMLYGTTLAGGAGGYDGGTVFSNNPVTGAETVLHSFGAGGDGYSPQASLIYVKGTLYGTTAGGGASCCGTVFSFNPKTSAENVVYSFLGGADGGGPVASLINVKGTLYGTTAYAGRYGAGTVFSIDPSTGADTVLYSFCSQLNCTDGLQPYASLIDVKGTLYGTTDSGGTSDYGTVFSLDPKTGTEKVVYSFCSQENCADGAGPRASLLNVNGTLYGTTLFGGAESQYCTYGSSDYCGTVFSLDPKTGAEKTLYSFCSRDSCTDGANPSASLLDVNGTLYDTTVQGGGYQEGTVFSIDPSTGAEKVLYSFCGQKNCADGAQPYASLLDVNNALYGTTFGYGGTSLGQTVFVLKKR